MVGGLPLKENCPLLFDSNAANSHWSIDCTGLQSNFALCSPMVVVNSLSLMARSMGNSQEDNETSED